MATALKLKSDIKKLKSAIASKATPKTFIPKLKAQLDKAESELSAISSGAKPRKTSTTKSTKTTLTALQKLIQKKKYGVYKGAGVNLEKDAAEGAFASGRRVSKGLKSNQFGDKGDNKGNVYYEYRPNRLDIKQPKKKQTYPKLEKGGMMAKGGEEPTYDSAGFTRQDDSRIIIKSGNNGKLKEIFNEYKNQKNELKANEVFDNEKMNGKSVFLFVNDELYDQYIQKSDEEDYAEGGMMAKGGEVRYKLAGNNFGQQIESGKKFAELIKKAHENQTSEHKYPENFIKEIAYTGKIVKNDGTYFLKDYSYKGVLDRFEFLGDKYFLESLKYLNRPTIKNFKFEDGGMMAKGGEFTPTKEIYSGKFIEIKMPKMGDFEEEKIIARYDKKDFVFKIYDNDKKRVLTRLSGLEFENNLMNGSYVIEGYMADGGEVGNFRFKKGDEVYAFQFASDKNRQLRKGIDPKYVVGNIKDSNLQKWAKVEIVEPWSDEKYWETYKVKLIDGHYDGFDGKIKKDEIFVVSQGQLSKSNKRPIAMNFLEEIIKAEKEDGYMAKGGSVNYGRSWTADRAKHNKSEDYEIPMNQRKFDHGGEVGQGFLIRDMREKLNRMFPDTFGFTVGNVSKEGNKTLNSAALIVDLNDPYRGLEDKDIESKLFFPQYKRDHNINFRVMQGGENTYFYFALESEKGDEYIGQFGFKDQGDVSSDYVTRFIAFLMEQYGLPFEVKHSVMAKGGYMAGGGEMHKADYFKDGGKVFSEKELKDILDEALSHFYQGLNQIDLAMRYLEVKGQGGLKTPLSNKLKLDDLRESVEKIDEYISK